MRTVDETWQLIGQLIHKADSSTFEGEKRAFLGRVEQLLDELGLPADVLIERASSVAVDPARDAENTVVEPFVTIKMYGREFSVAKSQLGR